MDKITNYSINDDYINTPFQFLSNLIKESHKFSQRLDVNNFYFLLKKLKCNGISIIPDEEKEKLFSSISLLLGYYYKNIHFLKICFLFLHDLNYQYLIIDKSVFSKIFLQILFYYHEIPISPKLYRINYFDLQISTQCYNSLRNYIFERFHYFNKKNKRVLINLF